MEKRMDRPEMLVENRLLSGLAGTTSSQASTMSDQKSFASTTSD